MEANAPLPDAAARRLARSDLDAVVGIDALLEGQTRRTYFERRLACALREPEMHLQFAIDDDRGLAGYILARVLEGEFGRASPGVRLEAIGVRPDAKGRHFGRRLLDGLAEEAKRRGIGDLRTQARWNDHAMLRWLDDHGFTLAPNHVVERRPRRHRDRRAGRPRRDPRGRARPGARDRLRDARRQRLRAPRPRHL